MKTLKWTLTILMCLVSAMFLPKLSGILFCLVVLLIFPVELWQKKLLEIFKKKQIKTALIILLILAGLILIPPEGVNDFLP